MITLPNPEDLMLKRRRLDLTQERAGKLIGKSRCTINRIECGDHSFVSDETILDYATLLDSLTKKD